MSMAFEMPGSYMSTSIYGTTSIKTYICSVEGGVQPRDKLPSAVLSVMNTSINRNLVLLPLKVHMNVNFPERMLSARSVGSLNVPAVT
jgi:hypothetical protein